MASETSENEPRSRCWLCVFDVDDTLLGDDDALLLLEQELRRAHDRLVLALNSSRPGTSVRRTLAARRHLPTPSYLVGAMGTEIQEGETGRILSEYLRLFDRQWKRDHIVALLDEMDLTPHAPEFQTPFKVSYDVPGPHAYAEVCHQLKLAGLNVKTVFSGGRNLDVLPEGAGKGTAVTFLHEKLNIPSSLVVVAGDSGNDVEMFSPVHKGIVVANADPELKRQRGDHVYHARTPYAAGVLEGLRFWGVL